MGFVAVSAHFDFMEDSSFADTSKAIYTVLVAFMNIVAFSDTNLIAPEDLDTLTPDSINSRIYGSKLVLLVEQCMITTQWGCKICLLLLYSKLTYVPAA